MTRKTALLSAIAALFIMTPAFGQTDEKKNAQDAAAAAAQAMVNAPEPEKEAPKPKYWTKSMLTSLSFNQTNLTNWAAGGVNNVTLASYIDINANYAKDKKFWNNRLQFDYGFIYQDDKPFIQKNTDRIYFESKYGHKASDHLNYSAQFTMRSQFTNSYNYVTPSNFTGDEPTRQDWMDARSLKSGFLSPATINVGLGIDWLPNPNKWLVVNFAPLTGGFTVVENELLRKTYGMKRRKAYQDESLYPYSVTDSDGNVTTHGEYYRYAKFELGAQLKVDLSVKINTNFSYTSQLVLFSDYLDKPLNVRTNWDNRINWVIAKYFTVSLTTFLIYDDNVLIKSEDDLDVYPDGRQRIQFRELFGFGFTYTFPHAK